MFSFLFTEKLPRLDVREAKLRVRESHSCEEDRVCGRLWLLWDSGMGGGMSWRW